MAIGREAFGRGAQMLWAQRRAGRLRRLQHSRLAALVAHARDCSPLYRDLYAGLPWSPDLAALPAVDKRVLNSAFDAWVCDARLTRSGVEEFLADPGRFGQPYLDEYFVCTSSGTTGRPGLFVHDRHACAVYLGMFGRLDATWLSWRDFARMELRGDRVAAVVGTGGHFAGASWVQFMRTVNPRWRRSWKLVSAQWPTDRIVAELNAHDPAIVLIYPSSLLQLLVPRERGELTISPLSIEVGGEAMSRGARQRAEAAFGCPVRTVYGASELDPIAFSCDADWLHYSSDWAILEPVQADFTPTPPGQASDTVLLTNLANRVAPIIRYDLGDSVTMRPDPCPCGSALPALRVAGRSDESLTFIVAQGGPVVVAPLAIAAAADRVRGTELVQLVQVGASELQVRLRVSPDYDDRSVWLALQRELRGFLADQGLSNVSVARSDQPAQVSQVSGKFRRVLRGDDGGDQRAAASPPARQ